MRLHGWDLCVELILQYHCYAMMNSNLEPVYTAGLILKYKFKGLWNPFDFFFWRIQCFMI